MLLARAARRFSALFAPKSAAVPSIWNRPGAWSPFDTFVGPRTISGQDVTPSSAMGLPAVWACASGIAADIAGAPVCVVEAGAEKGRTQLREHPVTVLFDVAPNPFMTAFTLRETLTYHALTWGNGYAEIRRDTLGRPRQLLPIHPSRVAVLPGAGDDDPPIYRVRGMDPKNPLAWSTIDAADVFHLHGLGDGLEGFSVVRVAAESLGLSIAAQSFGASFFGNDATMGLIVSPKGAGPTGPGLAEPELKAFHAKVSDARTQARGRFGLVTFNQPTDVQRMGVPPEEAQFLETRQFQIDEVCRWFRRSPQKVGHSARAQGWSTLEALQIADVNDCLMPWWRRWEQEANRKLLVSEPRRSLKHYVQGLMRGDSKARAEFYASAVSNGWMHRDEVRELEDMNPSGDENGDALTVQSAMVLLASLGKEPPKPPPGFPPRDDAEPPPPDDEEPEVDDEEEAYDARAARLRPVFVHLSRRIVVREGKAVEAAMKRHAKEPGAFTKWAAEWYAEQRGQVVEEFAPAVEALTGVADGEPFAALRSHAAALWPDPIARTGDAAKSKPEDLAAALADGVMAACRPKEQS